MNSAIGVTEFLLKGLTEQRAVAVAAELPEPGLDVEEWRGKPSLLLVRVPPVIHTTVRIPTEVGHPFRSMWATHSESSRKYYG